MELAIFIYALIGSVLAVLALRAGIIPPGDGRAIVLAVTWPAFVAYAVLVVLVMFCLLAYAFVQGCFQK